jgi:hypothetical protein
LGEGDGLLLELYNETDRHIISKKLGLKDCS